MARSKTTHMVTFPSYSIPKGKCSSRAKAYTFQTLDTFSFMSNYNKQCRMKQFQSLSLNCNLILYYIVSDREVFAITCLVHRSIIEVSSNI